MEGRIRHSQKTRTPGTYIPLKTSCFSLSLVEAVKEKLSVLGLLTTVLVVVAGAGAAGGARASLSSPCC